MEQVFEDFPVECLPPIGREAVKSVASIAQAHAALYAPTALAVVSYLACKRVYTATARPGRIGSNLYTLIVGRSGGGKDEAESLWSPLAVIEAEVRRKYAEEERPEWRAVLQQAEAQKKAILKDCGEERSDEVVEKLTKLESEIHDAKTAIERKEAILAEDFSKASLVKNLADSGEKIAIFSEEARDFVEKMLGRENETGRLEEGTLLRLYSGKRIKQSRKSYDEDTWLEEPRAAISILMQPDIFEKWISHEGMAASGMVGRCMFCVVPKRPRRYEDFRLADQTGLEAWKKWVEALWYYWRKHKEAKVARLSVEAERVFETYSDHIEEQDDKGALAGYESMSVRWAENSLRLALCLHVMKHDMDSGSLVIAADTMNDAVKIHKWFVRQTILHQSGVVAENNRTRNERLFKLLGQNRKAGTPVKKMISSKIFTDAREAQAVLTLLEGQELVARRQYMARNNRLATLWFLPYQTKTKPSCGRPVA